MNELALFAGAGGGLLASRLLGWSTVCAVEIDAYCRNRIIQRQEEGHLEPFPIWDDVCTFDGKPWRGVVDIVTGGFPCQPFSINGDQNGEEDHRNMWPDTARIIREVGPRFVFLENVAGLLHFDYFGRIVGELADLGYGVRWEVVSASMLGFPHRRPRLWIFADFSGVGIKRRRLSPNLIFIGQRRASRKTYLHLVKKSPFASRSGIPQPLFRRGIDGVADWMDRIRAIGNGQVPAVAAFAYWYLSQWRNDE